MINIVSNLWWLFLLLLLLSKLYENGIKKMFQAIIEVIISGFFGFLFVVVVVVELLMKNHQLIAEIKTYSSFGHQ